MYDVVKVVEDLEHLAPGPELAALLSTVDRSRLDAAQRVDVACARARLVAHMQAELLADMCAVAQDAPDPDFAADELSFATNGRWISCGPTPCSTYSTAAMPAARWTPALR